VLLRVDETEEDDHRSPETPGAGSFPEDCARRRTT
jgi:hypothetical protein